MDSRAAYGCELQRGGCYINMAVIWGFMGILPNNRESNEDGMDAGIIWGCAGWILQIQHDRKQLILPWDLRCNSILEVMQKF